MFGAQIRQPVGVGSVPGAHEIVHSSKDDAPTGASVPAGHEVQNSWFGISVKPPSQGKQGDSNGKKLPMADKKVPGGHVTQRAERAADDVEGGHVKHAEEPAVENVPGEQPRQAALVCAPKEGWKLPAGHDEQTEAFREL